MRSRTVGGAGLPHRPARHPRDPLSASGPAPLSPLHFPRSGPNHDFIFPSVSALIGSNSSSRASPRSRPWSVLVDTSQDTRLPLHLPLAIPSGPNPDFIFLDSRLESVKFDARHARDPLPARGPAPLSPPHRVAPLLPSFPEVSARLRASQPCRWCVGRHTIGRHTIGRHTIDTVCRRHTQSGWS